MDAPVDGPPIDAAPMPVTLTITQSGAPVTGVQVYFQNADSTLVAMPKTDATGTASAVMVAGGYVTAIDPFPPPAPPQIGGLPSSQLRTFAGVKPGDHLVLTASTGTSITINVTVPIDRDSNANEYQVITPCGTAVIDTGGGSGWSPTQSMILDGCGTVTDFLVIASNNTGESITPVSSLSQSGVAVADKADVTLAGTYAALVDVSFSYTHAPDRAGSLNVSHYLRTSRGVFSTQFGGVANVMADHTASAKFKEPAPLAFSAVVDTNVFLNSTHDVITWGPAVAAYDLDMTGLLLRDILDVPVYDVTTRRTTWVEATTGAAADLTVTGLQVTRTGEPSKSWRWLIAAPYTAGEAAFPALPTDIFDWTPRVTDSRFVDTLVNAQVPGGYDAARAHILDIFEQLSATGIASSGTGRVVMVGAQIGKLQRPLLRKAR